MWSQSPTLGVLHVCGFPRSNVAASTSPQQASRNSCLEDVSWAGAGVAELLCSLSHSALPGEHAFVDRRT